MAMSWPFSRKTENSSKSISIQLSASTKILRISIPGVLLASIMTPKPTWFTLDAATMTPLWDVGLHPIPLTIATAPTSIPTSKITPSIYIDGCGLLSLPSWQDTKDVGYELWQGAEEFGKNLSHSITRTK